MLNYNIMEEKKSILTEPLSEEEFKNKAQELAMQRHLARIADFKEHGTLSLRTFEGISKYRSIRRAIKRGNVSLYGDIYPKRPFSNRKRNKGTATYNRRKVHEQFRAQAID